MQVNQRNSLLRLWLVGTLVLLIGTGIVMRPDRDAARYFRHQHAETGTSDIEARRLVTLIRHYQGKGLTYGQIKSKLLLSGSLTEEALTSMIELDASLRQKDHARKQLTLFATTALLPPLIILEFGVAFLWARRWCSDWSKVVARISTFGSALADRLPRRAQPIHPVQLVVRLRPYDCVGRISDGDETRPYIGRSLCHAWFKRRSGESIE